MKCKWIEDHECKRENPEMGDQQRSTIEKLI